MTSFHIRPATPADVADICAVHCSNVARWQRWEAAGAPRPARYTDLSPYQRWLNGGPWLDPETCAFHLQRFLDRVGFVFVVELGGRVVAEAELSVADEPPPYGRNLNLSALYVHRNQHGQGFGSALMRQALALAAAERCDLFTVANAEAPGFYKKHGLKLAERWTRFEIPIRPGRAPHYTLEPLEDAAYDLVRGWAAPIGRYQNAHTDWERARPNSAPDFEEWRHLRLARQWIAVGRHRAALICEESPQRPGAANTFLFTPMPDLPPRLFSAARACAAQLGFTRLCCFARSDSKLPGAMATEYRHELLWKKM
jgi:ribosomal protein S18 acetylase RimI-like enzyme